MFVFFGFFALSRFSFMNIHKSQDCRGRGGGISLTPHYHFFPLHRHLEISWVVTAEGPSSAHNYQLDLNWEPLLSVSKHKSLTIKLRILYDLLGKYNIIWNKVSTDVKKEFNWETVYHKSILKTKIRSYGVETTNGGI